MTNKNQQPTNEDPREVPTRKDPGKTKPEKDPNLTPDKKNPINPNTDEPNDQSKIKNPIQDDPGKQITS